MGKDELIHTIAKLLKPYGDIDFLNKLDERELTMLTGYIRERIGSAAA